MWHSLIRRNLVCNCCYNDLTIPKRRIDYSYNKIASPINDALSLMTKGIESLNKLYSSSLFLYSQNLNNRQNLYNLIMHESSETESDVTSPFIDKGRIIEKLVKLEEVILSLTRKVYYMKRKLRHLEKMILLPKGAVRHRSGGDGQAQG